MKRTIRLAIFASGTGSNALNLISYLKNDPDIRIDFVLSNKEDAPVVAASRKEGVEVVCCLNSEVAEPGFLTRLCRDRHIDLIVLAGFLRQIPADLVQAFPDRIINIHPSLLPKYGGHGMYGRFVHEAVISNHEKESGISIHLVNEAYDQGRILSQFSCSLTPDDDVTSLQQKIHALEMNHFPEVVRNYIQSEFLTR